MQGIKFKQGLFPEGTGVCFHLSHQHWVNSGGSSAAAGLPKPCQLCPPVCCTAGPGEGGGGGGELPLNRGSRDNPGQGHSSCEQLHLALPGGSGTFQHCRSGATCPVLADPGPRRAVTNQSECRAGGAGLLLQEEGWRGRVAAAAQAAVGLRRGRGCPCLCPSPVLLPGFLRSVVTAGLRGRF